MFGEYLAYQTWDADPIAGTQGLVPTAWSRVHEQWAGTQMQNRFEKHAGRWMRERDYTAWLGVRSLGEAVTRTNSNDPKVLRDYLRGGEFQLGAFKGEALILPHLEPADAPAHPACGAAHSGVGIAAGGVLASADPPRHSGLR